MYVYVLPRFNKYTLQGHVPKNGYTLLSTIILTTVSIVYYYKEYFVIKFETHSLAISATDLIGMGLR